MYRTSDVETLDSGRTVRKEDEIGKGGQATAFKARDLQSGKMAVLKVFRGCDKQTPERLRFLVDNADTIHDSCVALYSPYDCRTSGDVASLASYARGETLEDFLGEYNATFAEAIQLALALALAIRSLHQLGIAHGDLHPGNVMVFRDRGVLKCYIIDFENFGYPGVAEPTMLGRTDYLCLELFRVLINGGHALPDIKTDLHSLAVMIHEILLVKHPNAGRDANKSEYLEALSSGWVHDPARADRVRGHTDGLPSDILGASLMRLFRRSLNPDRDGRASAAAWVDALRNLLDPVSQVEQCDVCQNPFIIETSRFACPICGNSALLKLTGNFRTIDLSGTYTVLGRACLGGSPMVSEKHAIIRRHGSIYLLESMGINGTFRWDKGWIRIPDRTPWPFQKGDQLSFANVPATVAGL